MLLKDGANTVYEAYVSRIGHASVGQYLINSCSFAIPRLKALILYKL